ncbi:hypothetical protein CRUP_007506 [Coryphaenoides rupestris]|nr:hypothetical protein CRUP_007506 [Coryphaenoides rupestris]
MHQTPPLSGQQGAAGVKQPQITEDANYPSLCYHDNQLVSGSLDALILKLVPKFDYYPDLMSTVCQLALAPQHEDPQADKMRIRELAPKMVQLLREWASSFPHDFRDERMMSSLKDITQHLATVDQVYRKALGQILQDVMRSMAAESRYQEALLRIGSVAADCQVVMKTKRAQRDLLSVCSDPFTLAQQLTHIELAVKRKTRARVAEFFIDVAKECFNIGNFNSLMAILSGMTMGSVSRLKKTWGKVKSASFDILEIVIPFFSLLIKDLYFLNQSSPSRLANGHINFMWQEVESPFQSDCRIQTFLLTTPVLNEDALYLASYESEGPENNTEKHRWKTLRASLLNRL